MQHLFVARFAPLGNQNWETEKAYNMPLFDLTHVWSQINLIRRSSKREDLKKNRLRGGLCSWVSVRSQMCLTGLTHSVLADLH